jgi:adenosine kinase
MSAGAPGSGRALICGSLAFDTIMVFGDRFANHILPDKIHILNVSFLVPHMRREYGGCAGNIAYNLALLGDEGVPMATVGSDFRPYRERLTRQGIATEHVREIASELTAQAFITTDLDDNQITAFHPGAMQHSHVNRVSEARGITLGIVAPDGRDGMIEHAAQFAAAGIPFIFDPGQGLPMFGAEELQRFLRQARWVTVNDYEWQLLQQKSRWGVSEIMQHVEALIVTRGAAGAVIHTRGEEIRIPAAPVRAVVDPTGAGDAFRAGLIHGLLHGHDWRTSGHIASLMGAIKVESRGTQNHRFTREEFDERLAETFG